MNDGFDKWWEREHGNAEVADVPGIMKTALRELARQAWSAAVAGSTGQNRSGYFCPGCGNQDRAKMIVWGIMPYGCKVCQYESDTGLPSVAGLLRGDERLKQGDWNSVDLCEVARIIAESLGRRE